MERTLLEDRPCSNPSAVDAFAKKVLTVILAKRANEIKVQSFNRPNALDRKCVPWRNYTSDQETVVLLLIRRLSYIHSTGGMKRGTN